MNLNKVTEIPSAGSNFNHWFIGGTRGGMSGGMRGGIEGGGSWGYDEIVLNFVMTISQKINVDY